MEPEGLPDERKPLLFVLGGAGVAVVSIPLAAIAGPPYLSFASLSPWLITFAIGLFCALFATPFLIHARLGGELEADARWERAVLWWGAVAIAVLGAAVICGLPSGFASGFAWRGGRAGRRDRGGPRPRDARNLADQRLIAPPPRISSSLTDQSVGSRGARGRTWKGHSRCARP